jgi:hypothetical protein
MVEQRYRDQNASRVIVNLLYMALLLDLTYDKCQDPGSGAVGVPRPCRTSKERVRTSIIMPHCILLLSLVLPIIAAMNQPLRSNVLLLLLDDVGYGDLDLGGQRTSPALTPNIAALAKAPGAVVFKRFYSGGVVCAPTRSTMLTGRNPLRECIVYVEENAFPAAMNMSTIAAYAKSSGYGT